jgi:hypothetical protein
VAQVADMAVAEVVDLAIEVILVEAEQELLVQFVSYGQVILEHSHQLVWVRHKY